MLRVNTDDALRISTGATSEQLREALQAQPAPRSARSPSRRRRASASRGCRRIATPSSATPPRTARQHELRPQSRPGGTYDFTMKPNIAKTMRQQTMVQALDTIDRRVNELGVSEPTIALQGDNGDQISCRCPASPTSRGPRRSSVRPRILELKMVEGGPAPTRRALLSANKGGQCLPTWRSSAAPPTPGAAQTGTQFFLVRKVAAVTGRTCAAHSRRSTRTVAQPCVSC